MTRRKANDEASSNAKTWIWAILGAVVFSLAGGGWAVRDYVGNELASRDELVVVAAKADVALDQQMEDIIARIAILEKKPRQSQYDRDQIKYLRDQLERYRKIRAGIK